MSNNLILLTGATGHLGFSILRTALEAGYHVRAAVRSEQKASLLKSNAVLQATPGFSKLTFTIVPDFLIPGAFDEAAKDTKYIIHVASPLLAKAPETADWDAHFIQPAVQGTLGVFESARKVGTVQRIVVTSSALAIVPLSAMNGGDGNVYDAENRVPEIEPPIPNAFVAYTASKVAALNRAEAWIEAEKPSFDAIHIHPTFIFGRDELATSTEYFQTGTNGIPVNIALGKEDSLLPNLWNDVADTAKLHVLALDPKIAGNQSFLASNDGRDEMTFNDAKEIVARRFPEAVKRGDLPNNGNGPTFIFKLDVSKTEKTFGIKTTSYEQTVVEVVGHYLELLEKERERGEGAQ